MAKFIFEMPEQLAAHVERHRIQRGFKSTAEAVRELIDLGVQVANPAEFTGLALKDPAAKPTLFFHDGVTSVETDLATGQTKRSKTEPRAILVRPQKVRGFAVDGSPIEAERGPRPRGTK